jgi:allantoate deiminase
MSTALGKALTTRLDELARFSDEPTALTRLYLSPAHKAAAQQVRRWMTAAGMEARIDDAGNVVGRYEAAEPGRPALLLGSHIDTVRNAGRYDGNLGVLAAIEAVGELHERGERLPYAVEVLAFGDEEGVRFPTTLIGSRAVTGTFDPAALDAKDQDGVTVREALQRFGCDPAGIEGLRRRKQDVLGYVELHIEQGPVLEAKGLPLGIVTAINGASRFTVEVTGTAGHAGTVPMGLRQDALAAAAEMILAVERSAGEVKDLVATVGRIEAKPGAVNVIPGDVTFTLDVRSPRDAARHDVLAHLRDDLAAIAGRRGVAVRIERSYEEPAATCATWLIQQLESAVARVGVTPLRLPSGAGHDGLAIAAMCPIGMLFVRCKGGISHNPAESITVEDADIAVRALLDFLRHFHAVPY